MEIIYDSWEKFENMWNLGRGSDKDSHDYILWVRHCFQFWCLFPRHYDFYKDDMVLLLEAATDFSADFGSLEEIQIFQFSRIDPSTGKSRYKLNDTIVDLLQEQCDSTYFRLDDIKSSISENTLHASLGDGSNVLSTLKDLCLAEKLRTLLILHEHGSPIYQVPRHLFIKLPLLRVLDFSHTNITDLPSSVGNLKHLKYLNLSWTPITKLPNPVCNLYNLQALKLRGCLKLVRLPKDIRKLKNLQQLDVDVNCLLISMPPGLGDLQKLKALPAFVVGKENGCHITELKHMNICGNFQILRLENISSAEEATEAKISTKDNIRKLQLQWTELQDGLEILENLRPPIRLQELHIVGYGGVRLPSWLGEYHPYKLVTITISDCRKCESLPSLGNIPFLKFLRISDMHAVKKIDNEFCGQKAFPKLEKLTLNAMPELEKWSGIKIGYFGYLLKLNISNCSKLTYLPNLSCLKSLLELEISLCPLLESFPKEGLPTSLGCIVIIDCPLLKDRCHTNEGPEWGTIAHIANIRIDYQQISHEQVQRTHNLTMMMKTGSSKQKLKLFVPQYGVASFLTQSGTYKECDLFVNKHGIQIVSSSLKEPVPSIMPTDEHLNLEDIEVNKVIGKGSIGIVQLVRHKWTGQFFALKDIQGNWKENHVKHILLEWKMNQSPYIVACYQSFCGKGVILMLLEYMDCGSLADFLKKVNSIPEPYLAAISIQVLKGLFYLHHEKHMIHGDLKPSNLLINHRGEVKITDFGAIFIGSAIYTSPESISGSKNSYKSNIWSLGLVLLECATGSFPYSASEQEEGLTNNFELMEVIVDCPPPCASSDQFSPEFCSFISACLQKDPNHRQAAHELMKHPFISKYKDLDVDLAAYFSSAGSLVTTLRYFTNAGSVLTTTSTPIYLYAKAS